MIAIFPQPKAFQHAVPNGLQPLINYQLSMLDLSRCSRFHLMAVNQLGLPQVERPDLWRCPPGLQRNPLHLQEVQERPCCSQAVWPPSLETVEWPARAVEAADKPSSPHRRSGPLLFGGAAQSAHPHPCYCHLGCSPKVGEDCGNRQSLGA